MQSTSVNIIIITIHHYVSSCAATANSFAHGKMCINGQLISHSLNNIACIWSCMGLAEPEARCIATSSAGHPKQL